MSDTHVAAMARQLADIMARYRQHEAESRRKRKDGAVVRVSAITDAILKPRWEAALDSVESDPVRFALRASAREIGWYAYAIGGLDLMHKVSDLMEEADKSGSSFAGATLDKWWDGIGGPKGTWVAVPMDRVRALPICTHPKDYAPTRVRKAAKHLLTQSNVTEEEKQLANKAFEGLKRRRSDRT